MAAEPFVFSDAVKRAMAQRDAVATGTALLDMRAGFRALWVDEHKEPFPVLTPHAAHDATNDPRILQEWSWYMSDANLAIVWPPGLGCIDCDNTHVMLDGIPPGTWGEQTRRGEHHLVTVPTSVTRKRRLPHGAGDFLAGPGTYTVLAPSPDRWPFDLDAPILPLDPRSPLGHVVLGTRRPSQGAGTPRISARAIKAVPEYVVTTVIDSLVQGAFGDTITQILAGHKPERYPTRSEADFELVLMATHFTRDAHVLAALLARSSRKVHDTQHPAAYIARTVANALARRAQKDAERCDHLLALLSAQQVPKEDVLDVTPPRERPAVRDALLTFAAITTPDAYTREDGWRRVPVEDMAELCGVHRQTVWRHLGRLEEQGRIECAVVTRRSDKGARKDSLIRLVEEPQGEVLPTGLMDDDYASDMTSGGGGA